MNNTHLGLAVVGLVSVIAIVYLYRELNKARTALRGATERCTDALCDDTADGDAKDKKMKATKEVPKKAAPLPAKKKVRFEEPTRSTESGGGEAKEGAKPAVPALESAQ